MLALVVRGKWKMSRELVSVKAQRLRKAGALINKALAGVPKSIFGVSS